MARQIHYVVRLGEDEKDSRVLSWHYSDEAAYRAMMLRMMDDADLFGDKEYRYWIVTNEIRGKRHEQTI